MKVIIAFLSILVVGCAACQEPSASQDASGKEVLPREYFSVQQRCIGAWDAVVEEWIGATGGMHHTIEQTRRSIENDKKTRLSALFRRVWAAQKGVLEENREEGGTIDLIFDQQIRGEVPDECTATGWLTPLLVEAPGVFREGAKEALLSEAPPEAREDGHTFSQWLIYSLLAPPKQ